MLDPDPLYVELPTCAPTLARYTVSNRGPHAVARPMNEWLYGFVLGLTLGVPVAILLGRVDRWLDVVWER